MTAVTVTIGPRTVTTSTFTALIACATAGFIVYTIARAVVDVAGKVEERRRFRIDARGASEADAKRLERFSRPAKFAGDGVPGRFDRRFTERRQHTVVTMHNRRSGIDRRTAAGKDTNYIAIWDGLEAASAARRG